MRLSFPVLAVALLFALVFSACKQDDTGDVQQVLDSAKDNSDAENEFSAVFRYMDERHQSASGKTAGTDSLLPSCATVTIIQDSANSAHWTVTVDFGTTNCLCQDGALRQGRLIGDYYGSWVSDTTHWTVTTQNYYVNEVRVDGTQNVTYLGNSTGHRRYRTVVNNATLTYTDATTATWTCDRITAFTAGDDTPLNLADDEFDVTGNASGQNRKGDPYTATVTTPLHYRTACLLSGSTRHFVSGVIELASGGNTLKLNYDPIGNAPCDKVVSIQWNNNNPTNITVN